MSNLAYAVTDCTVYDMSEIESMVAERNSLDLHANMDITIEKAEADVNEVKSMGCMYTHLKDWQFIA